MNVEFPGWGGVLEVLSGIQYGISELTIERNSRKARKRLGANWEACLHRGCRSHNHGQAIHRRCSVGAPQAGLLHGAETLFVSKRPMKRL
jgi:hypothetical protein